jgi:hypothetical protein
MADAVRHLQVLEERHRALDAEVDDAQRGRITDSVRLSRLKHQRLALRDAIERLRALSQAQT